MRYSAILVLPFLLTSCFTTVNWPARYVEEDLKVISSTGDTLYVNVHHTYSNYYKSSVYYDGWRFYYNQNWVAPDFYFRNYYIPTYIYRDQHSVYYPQQGVILNIPPKKSYEPRKAEPRSSGTTSKKKSRTLPKTEKRSRDTKKEEKG